MRVPARLQAVVFPVGLLLVWELLARSGLWPIWLFPPPTEVSRSLLAMLQDGRLVAAAARSLRRLAQGYAVSALIGVPLGILLARSRFVQRALRPALLGLQALPSICWLPLAILWFGLSEISILFVVLMGSVLAIAIATEDGVLSIDPVLLRAAGTLGIRGPRFHLGVLLPAALPGILTGLKLGWSFAWRALLAGELLFASGGLGQLLAAGREVLDAGQVMAVMVSIILIGMAVDQVLFRFLELRVRRRWGLAEAA
jgi:NitT/TauT family transport system permease protein